MPEPVQIGVRGHVLYQRGGGCVLRLALSKDGDERRIVARPDFAAALAAESGVLPAGPRWSIEQDRDGVTGVVGMGGLEPLGDGRWGAWAYLADLTPRQWWFAATGAHAVLDWARRHLAVRTIQAVPAPHGEATRLLKWIGFVDIGERYMVWEG